MFYDEGFESDFTIDFGENNIFVFDTAFKNTNNFSPHVSLSSFSTVSVPEKFISTVSYLKPQKIIEKIWIRGIKGDKKTLILNHCEISDFKVERHRSSDGAYRDFIISWKSLKIEEEVVNRKKD